MEEHSDASAADNAIRTALMVFLNDNTLHWDLDVFFEQVCSGAPGAFLDRGSVKSKAQWILAQMKGTANDPSFQERIKILIMEMRAETKLNNAAHRESWLRSEEAKQGQISYNVQELSGGIHLPIAGTSTFANCFNFGADAVNGQRSAYRSRDAEGSSGFRSQEALNKCLDIENRTPLTGSVSKQKNLAALKGHRKQDDDKQASQPQSLLQDVVANCPVPSPPKQTIKVGPSAASTQKRPARKELKAPLSLQNTAASSQGSVQVAGPEKNHGRAARTVSLAGLSQGASKRALNATLVTLQELAEAGWDIVVMDDGRISAERPKKRRVHSNAVAGTSNARASEEDSLDSDLKSFLLPNAEQKPGRTPQGPKDP